MNREMNQILFALLRSVISGNTLHDDEKQLCSEEVLSKLFSLSSKHDVAHLVCASLEKNALLIKGKSWSEKFSREKLKAIYRYVKLNHEFTRLCEALETAGILYIPLKGAVIREYYPEPWMRTSCDIDVLVHEEEVDKTAAFLVEKYGYICKGKGTHDVQLFSSSGIHVELHYNLVEEGHANMSSDILRQVWEAATVHEGCRYRYEMTDEMFYFYHIAHMAKHFEAGGCGIRSFVDLWILEHIESADQAKRDELLQQGGLLQFAENSRKLSKVWMEGLEGDPILWRMADFILRGGVYGTQENRVIVQQQKKGGRFKYIFSRIFLPYNMLKFQYPVLQKHPWLLPIMEVRRWFNLMSPEKAKSSVRELKHSQGISKIETMETKEFLENIGLNIDVKRVKI